jgi:hypothetical protein
MEPVSNNNNNSYEFYCLSLNNKERKESMKSRFTNLGINPKFYQGVSFNDKRISDRKIDDNVKRVWSCMYGHLDMIYYFYHNTDKEYGVFCEDDLLIHKDLKCFMPKIINDFKELNLDVLLLSYLIQTKINENLPGFKLKTSQNLNYSNSMDSTYKYHNYQDQVWGTQMYMLSKKQAGILLNKYYTDYADRSIKDTNMVPFSADWLLTKDGNRSVIFPMVASEDNLTIYENHGQHNFHKTCFSINFDKDTFI